MCLCVCMHTAAGVVSATLTALELVFSAPLTPGGGKYSISLYQTIQIHIAFLVAFTSA